MTLLLFMALIDGILMWCIPISVILENRKAKQLNKEL